MNTLVVDESEVVTSGVYGAKPTTLHNELWLKNYRATDVVPPVLPSVYSVTMGIRKGLNMLANNVLGCCVVACAEHGRMFKALVSYENNTMTFEKGFRPPHPPYTETLYYTCGIASGEPAPHPDNGLDPGFFYKWFFGQGLCDAYGQVSGPGSLGGGGDLDLVALKTAILEYHGLACAFVIPRPFESQFNVTPFSYTPGTQMTNEGHAMYVTGWDDTKQLFEVCTWGVIWYCTYEFMSACLESAFAFVSQEDAVRLGINFSALIAAITAIPGSQVDDTPSTDAPQRRKTDVIVTTPDHGLGAFLDDEAKRLVERIPGIENLVKHEIEKSLQIAVPVILSKEFETLAKSLLVGLVV